MDIRNRRAIHETAKQALASAPGSPNRTIWVYSGILCLLSLLSTVLSFVLDHQIAGTGGLSNIGLRSILSTAQAVLPLIQFVTALGLGLGRHVAALEILRGQETSPRTLLEGFRRFGSLLCATILESGLYFSIAMTCLTLSSYLFMTLPLSQDFTRLMESLLGSSTALDPALLADPAIVAPLTKSMIPMFFIFLALFALIFIPLHYRLRMLSFCLADTPRRGALGSILTSFLMTRRNCFALFRLDLDLWWFYLLEGLITVIAYGEEILPFFGISLPFSGTTAYFVFLILSLLGQAALYCLALNRFTVTYAAAYEALRQTPPKEEPLPFATET